MSKHYLIYYDNGATISLYGWTTDKSVKNDFISFRDGSKFIVKKHSIEDSSEIERLYGGLELDRYPVSSSNKTYSVIMTREEEGLLNSKVDSIMSRYGVAIEKLTKKLPDSKYAKLLNDVKPVISTLEDSAGNRIGLVYEIDEMQVFYDLVSHTL